MTINVLPPSRFGSPYCGSWEIEQIELNHGGGYLIFYLRDRLTNERVIFCHNAFEIQKAAEIANAKP